MAIEIVDVVGLAHERKKRKVIMDTRKMHAWMSVPDGGSGVLNPGGVALIEGGSFYKLENTGTGPLVLMGTRTGPHSANKHINYETGKDMRGIRPPRGGSYGAHVAPEGEEL
jgi:hypothetical protein